MFYILLMCSVPQMGRNDDDIFVYYNVSHLSAMNNHRNAGVQLQSCVVSHGVQKPCTEAYC